MILYFANRNLDILDTASTELPDGIRILSDTKTDSIETGSKTFSCSLALDNRTRLGIEESCKAGNFLLRSSDDENEFYTIIESELNTDNDEFNIYAEDAGLDLLNTVVPAYKATAAHSMAWYINFYLNDFAQEWEIGLDESSSNTLTLEWDSETTLTERLLSIATNFNCEIAFSYAIKGLNIENKYVDIYSERGNKIAQHNYYINREVRSITTKQSIADLATAFDVKGGTLKGKSTPITLTGANYSSDGTTTHSPAIPTDDYQIVGPQVRCKSAMNKWASRIDPDGLFVRQWQMEETNIQTLFSRAVAELKKVINGSTTYDVQFNEMPDVKIGDRINIVDDKDEIYIEARVLKLTKSVIANEVSAELGDYIIKKAGISERVQALSEAVREQALSATSISITSTNGMNFTNTDIDTTLNATVFYGDEGITTQIRLEEVFGSGVAVKWYRNGVLVGSGFTYYVNSANASETYIVKVEV